MSDKGLFILIFTGVWVLLGIIFLIIAISMYFVQKKKTEVCTAKTIGTVTDVVHHSAGRPKYSSWHPVIQYTTMTGEMIKKVSAYGTNPPKYSAGDTVHIHYNPKKTDEFYLSDDKVGKIVRIVFMWVGIGMIFIGVLVGTLVGFLW
ncbi:MAG: DUF3592 domain-containing protein [Clostridia bacterium]|nr:DUF3592 domain-containing protein [Clostridia bacterium]